MLAVFADKAHLNKSIMLNYYILSVNTEIKCR